VSIQSEIITALASVAGARVYPDLAPQDAALPLVIYKRTAYEPLMKLDGYASLTKSTFMFECWATTKAGSLTLAGQVQTAIEASVIAVKFREPSTGDEYEVQVDQFVEPIAYSFWHA